MSQVHAFSVINLICLIEIHKYFLWNNGCVYVHAQGELLGLLE